MIRRLGCAFCLAAVFLTFSGAGMTSHAAVTWEENGGLFRCYDEDGEPVSDSWVKDGGRFYYIGGDGFMVTDQLVEGSENTYYMDGDGEMVKNKWVSLPNGPESEAQCEQDVATVWYYFGSSGKAHTGRRKTVGGKKYMFDRDGHMLSGWQTYGRDGELYYLGAEDEGFIHTGWQYLEPDERAGEDYDGKEWFYFRPANGEAVRGAKKQINGRYYTFDGNGVMQDKWAIGTPSAPEHTNGGAASAGSASPSAARYREGEGDRQSGWVYACAPDDPEENGDRYWYYLDKNGIPFNYRGKDGTDSGYGFKSRNDRWLTGVEDKLTHLAAKVINEKTYLFDKDGKMLTGLYLLKNVKREGSSSDLGPVDVSYGSAWIYYFNSEEGSAEGQMMTGRQTVVGEDGEKRYYYFQKNGQAYRNAIVNGRLYGPAGSRIGRSGNYEYTPIEVKDGSVVREAGNNIIHGDCIFLINDTGQIKRSGTVVIGDDTYIVKNYEAVKQ